MKDTFTMQMGEGAVRVRYTRGMQTVKGREFHLYHELLLLKGGEADLITEKERIRVFPNTLLVIPRERFHQIVLRGAEEDYCRCVLRIEHTPELASLLDSKLECVYAMQADNEIELLFERLINAFPCDFSQSECKYFLQAVAILILLQLEAQPQRKMNSDDNTKPFNRITYDALQYIDKHIYESVKIDQIAKCLHVSRSYLNHVFRADLNIPIHTYILKKKLVAAHQQINMGASPTEVAQKYGFLDYSGFYKQYVKMFGITPSNRKKAGMH